LTKENKENSVGEIDANIKNTSQKNCIANYSEFLIDEEVSKFLNNRKTIISNRGS
jgi:uncharacterized protein YjgD (DUF1641 family)